jgi:hypothetical protein
MFIQSSDASWFFIKILNNASCAVSDRAGKLAPPVSTGHRKAGKPYRFFFHYTVQCCHPIHHSLAVAAAVVRQLLKRWVLSEYTTTIRMDIQAKQKHSSSENKQNIATTVHIQSFFLSFFLYNSKEKFSLSDAARRRMSMLAHTRHS